MVDSLRPVISRPGMYRVPATAASSAPGVYVLNGGTEGPAGVFAFPQGPAFDVLTRVSPPSAVLTFAADDLPSTTHTIQVTASHGDESYQVRSAWNRFAAGGAVLIDYEIPLGVPVSYQGAAFDADGNTLGATDPVTVQIDSDPSKVWFSDPTNPNLVVQVDAFGAFGEDLTEERDVQVYQIGNRAVALLGSLGKLTSIPMPVRTTTVEDGVMLRRILRQTSVLVRSMPPADLPRQLFVVVPKPSKKRTGSVNDIQYGGGWANWDLVGDEVSPSTLNILVPAVTWQSFIDAFPGASWQDVIDFYAGKSWFDVIKEFSSGGA